MIRSGCPMVTRVHMSPVRMYVYHQLWVASLSCIFSSVIGRMFGIHCDTVKLHGI